MKETKDTIRFAVSFVITAVTSSITALTLTSYIGHVFNNMQSDNLGQFVFVIVYLHLFGKAYFYQEEDDVRKIAKIAGYSCYLCAAVVVNFMVYLVFLA